MKLLTRPEAAKFLRISEDKLRDLAAAGEVPGMKIGGQWRFIQERLEEYIREETERQTTLLKTAPAFTAPVEQRARASASRRRPIPSLAI